MSAREWLPSMGTWPGMPMPSVTHAEVSGVVTVCEAPTYTALLRGRAPRACLLRGLSGGS